MTSIPPQKQGLQGQSASSDTPANTSSSSPTPANRSSYANATRKSATDSTAAPVTVGGSSQHGQSTSASSVSGKPMQQQTNTPSSTSSPGVTIVNGAPASQQQQQGDHSRKPSVTITSAGTSGYIPNGGPPSRPNSLQFGFANQQTSPMGNPAVLAGQPQSGLGVSPSMNPRVTSPQTSPSPIPQPASSGGRPPPSSYQSQGNVPNFGSFGDAGDANVCIILQAPTVLLCLGILKISPIFCFTLTCRNFTITNKKFFLLNSARKHPLVPVLRRPISVANRPSLRIAI